MIQNLRGSYLEQTQKRWTRWNENIEIYVKCFTDIAEQSIVR